MHPLRYVPLDSIYHKVCKATANRNPHVEITLEGIAKKSKLFFISAKGRSIISSWDMGVLRISTQRWANVPARKIQESWALCGPQWGQTLKNLSYMPVTL